MENVTLKTILSAAWDRLRPIQYCLHFGISGMSMRRISKRRDVPLESARLFFPM